MNVLRNYFVDHMISNLEKEKNNVSGRLMQSFAFLMPQQRMYKNIMAWILIGFRWFILPAGMFLKSWIKKASVSIHPCIILSFYMSAPGQSNIRTSTDLFV